MINIRKSKKIVIITDLEPDDFVALILLFLSGMITDQQVYFIISAWQDVQHKARCFKKFLQDTFPEYSNCSIYLGEPNKNNYFLPLDTSSDEHFLLYREFDPSDSLIINLAPVRELISYYKCNSKIFANCELAVYGSFNIRSVLSEKEETPSLVVNIFNSFSSVLLYETYWATGKDSSLVDADVLNIIRTKHPYLLSLIIWWNEIMIQDCLQSCQNLPLDSNEYQRKKTRLDRIEAEPHQFVNADTGLMAVLIAPELQQYSVSGTITFDPATFYTVFTDDAVLRREVRTCSNDANSKIRIIKCTDDSLLTKEIGTFKQVLLPMQ